MIKPRMKNSDLFFAIVKDFDKERREEVERHRARIHDLEALKGSSAYDGALKEEEERFRLLEDKEKETRIKLLEILTSMKKANASRGYEAPTTEELNIIEALKGREKVTEEELTRAAKSVKNPLLLGTLTEISHKNGYLKEFYSDDMSAANVERALYKAASEITDYTQHYTTKASRMTDKFMRDHYGNNTDFKADREPMNTKNEVFWRLFGCSTEDFYNAIDTEAEES